MCSLDEDITELILESKPSFSLVVIVYYEEIKREIKTFVYY